MYLAQMIGWGHVGNVELNRRKTSRDKDKNQ